MSDFFKNAFNDMKEGAKAQHEVDKANFQACKAEAKADFQEKKAMRSIEKQKAERQAELDEQLAEAKKRIEAANARLDSLK